MISRDSTILLINVPPIQNVIPLNTGVAYIKAYLDIQNISNTLLNMNYEYLEQIPVENIISNHLNKFKDHSILCFSVFDISCFEVLEKMLKILDVMDILKDKKIIIGGNHFMHFDNKIKCEYLESDDLSICDTSGEMFFQELFNLPSIEAGSFTQYCGDQCDLTKTPMISFSRGCINRCKFCPHYKINNRKITFRNHNDVIHEMIELSIKFGFTHFWLDTDNISNNIKSLHEFATKLIKYNKFLKKKLSWRANFSLQTKYNEPINYNLLFSSGCHILMFGLETFSDQIRIDMNKPKYTNEDIFNLAEKCKRSGIKLIINLIVGFITESETEFQKSSNILNEFFEKYSDIVIYAVINNYYILSEDAKCGYQIEFDENGDWIYNENTISVRERRLQEYLTICKRYGIDNKHVIL